MTNTLSVSCPECNKQIKVAAELAGKKIRCKGCSHVFPVKARASAKAASESKAAGAVASTSMPGEEEDGKAYGVTLEKEGFRCPNCANEMESTEAIVCLFCGYNTVTRMTPGTRKVHRITGWEQTKWSLPGGLCILGIFIILGLLVYYHFELPYVVFDKNPDWAAAEKELGPDEASRPKVIKKLDTFSAYMFHPMIEVWLLVIGLFACYSCGKFAYGRLIKEPRPPERVKVG